MNILAIAGGIYLAGVLIAGTVLYRKNAVEKIKADLPAYSFVMLLWPLAGLVLAGVAITMQSGDIAVAKQLTTSSASGINHSSPLSWLIRNLMTTSGWPLQA